MRFLGIVVLLVAGVGATAWETHWLRSTDADRQLHIQRVISNGDVAALQRLVDGGVDLDVRDGDGTTPLLAAALFGREREAEVLIRAGAAIDIADHRGWTPCMLAAAGGYSGVLNHLIRAGADVNAVSFDGRTALNFARNNDHPELVSMLLEAGARPGPLQSTCGSHPSANAFSTEMSEVPPRAATASPLRHHHGYRPTRSTSGNAT